MQAAPSGLSAKRSSPARPDIVMNPRASRSPSFSAASVLERSDTCLMRSSIVMPRLPSALSLHMAWRIRISLSETLAIMVADTLGQPGMGSYGFAAKL